MSTSAPPPDPQESTSPAARPSARGSARRSARQRARLAEVFGEVLPETTADERGPDGRGYGSRESAADAWLRDQVPPHHGQ